MLSVVVDNKVLDYKYKKLRTDHYAFSVGDIPVGQIFRMTKSWSAAVTFHPNKGVGSVHGFKTRTDAAQYMLQCIDLNDTKKDNNETYYR